MRVRALTVVAVAVAGLTLAACDPVTPATSSPQSPAAAPPVAASSAPAAAAQGGDADKLKDVEIAGCAVDGTLHWPSADLKITNHTSKTSNYMVNVEFTDPSGTRVAEGIAATNNLAAGQAANVKAAGTAAVQGKISCKVTSVTRYAAP